MNDYTKEIGFWQRLESFVKDVQVGCDMGEEEKDMILHNCKLKILDLQRVGKSYCECSFVMIRRDQKTQRAYCFECKKEIKE